MATARRTRRPKAQQNDDKRLCAALVFKWPGAATALSAPELGVLCYRAVVTSMAGVSVAVTTAVVTVIGPAPYFLGRPECSSRGCRAVRCSRRLRYAVAANADRPRASTPDGSTGARASLEPDGSSTPHPTGHIGDLARLPEVEIGALVRTNRASPQRYPGHWKTSAVAGEAVLLSSSGVPGFNPRCRRAPLPRGCARAR